MPYIVSLLLLLILVNVPPLNAAQDQKGPTNLSTNPSVDNKLDVVAGQKSKINVLSWNVSKDAFVQGRESFKALVKKEQSDILLLDEVSPSIKMSQLYEALPTANGNDNGNWHINVGVSGGRQRNVVISRMPQEVLPEFSKIIPYPERDKAGLREGMMNAEARKGFATLDAGIAVNGVIVVDGHKRLLVVSADLECCGNNPSSWPENKRRIEAREIRRLVKEVVKRTDVDGIIVAGDFNLVSTVMPLIILSGPYTSPHFGLIAAELKHLDGNETWTWDGRGTEFPSRVMDLVVYSPNSLRLTGGYIFDPDDISPAELNAMGIQASRFSELSEHRPVIAQFEWH